MKSIRKENPKRMASKLSDAIDAVDLEIRRYLLHRHLAHWHPISTAPHNQDLEIRAQDENGLVAIPFPCQRTNASDWINTDLGTRVYMRPVRWRIWQKAKSPQPHRLMMRRNERFSVEGATMSKFKYPIRAIGVTLVLMGAAVWSGTSQSQVIAMNLRSDAGYSYHQIAPDNDGELAVPARLHRQIVSYGSAESPSTIIIDTPNTYLYFILGGGKAIRYGIGIGREGFTWSGVKNIERKSEWPDWIPPADMLHRQPYLPRFMAGGSGNPLGARAMYLSGTVYRIHGTNAPATIGKQVSSGCIRMLNEDVIDLYDRTHIGTKVVVLPMNHIDAASLSRPLALTALRGVAINRTSVR